MANDYVTADTPEKKEKTDSKDDGDVCREALDRYHLWVEREGDNTDAAYEDLEFYSGEGQWDEATKAERLGRPCLTINRLPQFVHQVTGDMRQMKPSIKTVPVDSRGDKETAETIAGMIRYVENRSDANAIYMTGADSQVVCGVGAWQVVKEYAGESTFNQELRIIGVDDAVAIAWDPDAVLPTKEDAKWCIVPVDVSRETFKKQYPDAALEDFETAKNANGWFSSDKVRIAAYWVKKPIKRKLALMPDGAIIDLTDPTPDELEEAKGAKRIENRDSFKVCRYLITACHMLEETDWPGLFIPIVPVVGEEIKIGARTIRKGLVRDAKDPQRRYNYFVSAQTEVVALQPKAPFTGTEKNFEKYQGVWQTANSKNHPFLPYEPDPKNGGQPPQRVPPPVNSSGIAEGIALAIEDMKGTIGIYDAGLGNRSNETSGKAIIARQREGDVSTFLYVDNWTRAIKHTGRILIDLIPHVYDTERKIRIMGEDGKVDLKDINKAVGVVEVNPETGEQTEVQRTQNDVTIGAYDVVLDTGPSFTTKRQEAKEGMAAFVQAVPQSAAAIMDLYAKAQDWPLHEEIGQRFEAMAPPPIQQLIARQKQEHGEGAPQPQPPSPAEQMQMKAGMIELEGKQLDNEKKKVDIATAAKGLQEQGGQPGDPLAPIKAQGEMIANQIAAETGRREIAILDLKVEEQKLKNNLLRAELASKAMGVVHDAQSHHAGMAERAANFQRNGAETEQPVPQ